MAKIIIDNRSDLTDLEAVKLVSIVVKTGRISNNNRQYCYLSTFLIDGFNYQVSTDMNKKSDRFIIVKEPAKT
jgi:hypothetical protein